MPLNLINMEDFTLEMPDHFPIDPNLFMDWWNGQEEDTLTPEIVSRFLKEELQMDDEFEELSEEVVLDYFHEVQKFV